MNSMTGFGVARAKVGKTHLLVEVRSLNHRFCEVNLRFPGRYASLEPEVARRVRQRFSRGKFDIFLKEESVERVKEEVVLARKSYQVLKTIQKDLRLKTDITLSDILSFREILFSQFSSENVDALHPSLLKLIDGALSGLEKMRRREGERLQKWFVSRNKVLLKMLQGLQRLAKQTEKKHRQKVSYRMKSGPDGERSLQETMITDKSDVTEEIVRLKSHLEEFGRFALEKGPVGRKVDFLAQEMGREINTVGSKSHGVKIAHLVIEFKSELERIKEQIQNVE